MAKGISNRTHLNIPQARRAMDVDGLQSNVLDVLRNIDRWANTLPFGSVGFHFTRNTNESATAPATETTITWNNVVQDRENWMPRAGTVSTIVVPRELSGLYVFRYAVYFGGGTSSQYPWIRVNGLALTNNDGYTGNQYIPHLVTFAMLNDGDEITAGNTNLSGGNTTIAAGGGGASDALVPSLQAWRISLI